LINLLDNAIKYSPEPARVTVRLEKYGESIRIAVEDQGIGIPKRFLKRIFQRFYRIQREQTPMPRGTGLGLYVVASLVRRLGGTIHAQSEGEGKGACFLIDLPFRLQSKRQHADNKAATEPKEGV
jgi:signal transduction histidine kinase